ncbi:hypothetical protein ACWEOW_14035 [Monashia sp. NPDC004114]
MLELASGGRDGTNVAAAARGEPLAQSADLGVRADPLDGFDRGPADQPEALFGDRAAMDVGVGLALLFGLKRAHEAR